MRNLSFLVLAMFVTSCAGTPPEILGIDKSNYPASWPQPTDTLAESDECPEIKGAFSSGGQSNSTISEWFSNPIYERNSFGEDEIAHESNYFTISPNMEEKRLYFSIFSPDDELLASGLYKQFERCENGWYVLENFDKGGSGDSPVRSSYEKLGYGIAEDKSLLIYSYYQVVSGKLVIGSETQTGDTWYRYKVRE